jgi:hypothetical protein
VKFILLTRRTPHTKARPKQRNCAVDAYAEHEPSTPYEPETAP